MGIGQGNDDDDDDDDNYACTTFVRSFIRGVGMTEEY